MHLYNNLHRNGPKTSVVFNLRKNFVGFDSLLQCVWVYVYVYVCVCLCVLVVSRGKNHPHWRDFFPRSFLPHVGIFAASPRRRRSFPIKSHYCGEKLKGARACFSISRTTRQKPILCHSAREAFTQIITDSVEGWGGRDTSHRDFYTPCVPFLVREGEKLVKKEKKKSEK
jgi:hypothetical protein